MAVTARCRGAARRVSLNRGSCSCTGSQSSQNTCSSNLLSGAIQKGGKSLKINTLVSPCDRLKKAPGCITHRTRRYLVHAFPIHSTLPGFPCCHTLTNGQQDREGQASWILGRAGLEGASPTGWRFLSHVCSLPQASSGRAAPITSPTAWPSRSPSSTSGRGAKGPLPTEP